MFEKRKGKNAIVSVTNVYDGIYSLCFFFLVWSPSGVMLIIWKVT